MIKIWLIERMKGGSARKLINIEESDYRYIVCLIEYNLCILLMIPYLLYVKVVLIIYSNNR